MAKTKVVDIRNVAFCGHGSAGKTTLLDKILIKTGAASGHPSVDEGTSILKVFLHISSDEQAERLRARILDPEKSWKFDRSDLDTRSRWDAYSAAYENAISATSTSHAPWYVVPADRKWVRNAAVAGLLHRELIRLDPRTPAPRPELAKLQGILGT